MPLSESKGHQVYCLAGASLAFLGVMMMYFTRNLTLESPGAFLYSVWNYLSYFTIWSNLLVMGVYLSLYRRQENLLSGSIAQTGIMLFIMLTCVVYHFMLRHVWNLEGWSIQANWLLHYITPLGYFFHWLLWGAKETRWRAVVTWPLLPLFFLFYSLVKGLFIGRYPYPFLNVTTQGYLGVFRFSVILLTVFIVLSAMLVAVLRWFEHSRTPVPRP